MLFGENPASAENDLSQELIYDPLRLQEICAGNEGLRHRILREYLRVSPAQVDELVESILGASGNEDAARVAHGLKGSTLQIGANKAGRLFESIERGSLKTDGTSVVELVRKIFAELVAVLEKELQIS